MQKKRYGILIGLTIITWVCIGLVIWRIDPVTVKDMLIPNSYFPMGLLMYLGLFFLLSILLMSSKRAAVWAGLFMIFVYLRIFQLGSILNGILLLGIGVVGEVYRKMK